MYPPPFCCQKKREFPAIYPCNTTPMAKQIPMSGAGEDERFHLTKLTEQYPLFRIHSTTPTTGTTRYDALVYSGGSLRETEVKVRDDVRYFSTVYMDLSKWNWMMNNTAAPMFVAVCLAGRTAYVWDLMTTKALPEPKWVWTPVDNRFPDGRKECVLCVEVPKASADHKIHLTYL